MSLSPLATLADTAEDLAAAELHRRLAHHHRQRLTPTLEADPPRLDPSDVIDLRRFLARERQAVAARADTAPTDPDGFVAWFEALHEDGPGQGDALFPWLAEHASLEEMRWFLQQELSGEAGFDDLVALSQVKMPDRPKMEMARNLWDEVGRGNPAGVHGTLLMRMADELGITSSIDEAVWEPLALANLMAGMAVERYAYHSVGALGVVELTAPGRVAQVALGLRRLGVSAPARRYYELHATLDIEHFRRWQSEVLHPLVADEPRTAPLLAQGALMRLEAGRRCFERYRSVLMPS